MMEVPVFLIVVIEFCERLCYYTFQGTQKSWLQDRGFSNAGSNAVVSLFALMSYVSCFYGGYLADSSFGRYRAIAVLVIMYAIGCFVAAIAVRPGAENVVLYMVGTMGLVAFGTGGIKPNVCTFGADQIDPAHPNATRRTESFFMYFYLTVNLGALVAFGWLVNVTVNGVGTWIPARDGYFFAYMFASLAMAAAALMFLGGTFLYREESFKKNSQSVVGEFIRCLGRGWTHPMGKLAAVGWCLIPCVVIMTIAGSLADYWAVSMLNMLVTLACSMCLIIAHRDNSWLGENEVSRSLNMVPVQVAGSMAFGILYNSMTTYFQSQACQMDSRIGSGHSASQINGSFFNIADCLAVIICTPLINDVAIPAAQRLIGRPVTTSMKIYAGVGCAILAQMVAAGLEFVRKSREVLDVESHCSPLEADGTHVHMSNMSAFWMGLPFFLVGMGEVLVNPGLQHLAYVGAPASTRSLMQAFTLFAGQGFPSALTSPLSLVAAKWTPNNLNHGSLESVYFLLSAVGLAGCVLFSYVSSSSTSAELEATDTEKQNLMDSDAKTAYT
eukprot:TRINITY_DN45228_c0_g1_i1.p1 TRINITY_DN45228_c0_g1~~TRINITY_DN45228_c0_g1_i1.p1  ORF type:complete len:555 (+),score=47.89 TRINITY_DN45228_c0_g1_i1:106-1770(+)